MRFKLCLCRHRPPETFKRMLLLFVFLKWIFLSQNYCHALITIRLGAIFEQTDDSTQTIESSFRNAIKQANLNSTIFRINFDIRHIASENSYHANKAACDLVQSGIWALFSSSKSSTQLSWLLSSYADHFHLPYFKLSSSSALSSNYTFNLYPKNSLLTNAILSLIESDDNSNSRFTFFYEHYEDLAFYKKLFEHSSTFKLVQINGEDIVNTLEQCKMAGESQFLVALSLRLTESLLNEAQRLGMMTEYHRYVLVNLDSSLLNLSHFKNINKNITWFNLQNVASSHQKPLEHNLINDAVHLFLDSVRQLNKDNLFPPKTTKTFCNSLIKNEDGLVNFSSRTRWKSSERVIAKIKQNEFRGTTGLISFDARNQRKSLELTVNRLTAQKVKRIGRWHSSSGIQFFEIDSNLSKQIASKKFRIGVIESMPFVSLQRDLPSHWPMKHRLKGLYIDLIELLKRSIGFADYDLYLFSREEYFSSNRRINQNSMGPLRKAKQHERAIINHRLISEPIDFVIGELTNELDQIYDEKSDENSIESSSGNSLKPSQHIESAFTMPISALFIKSSLCTALHYQVNPTDHLFCSSHQFALNNSESFFKVFDLTLWTLLVGCYLMTSVLMYLVVNFGASYTYSIDAKKTKESKNDKSTTTILARQRLSRKHQQTRSEPIKSSLKKDDHYDQQSTAARTMKEKLLKNGTSALIAVNKKEEDINEDNRASTLIELSDNSHLSSSTALGQQQTTNEQLVQLRLVELGMNLYSGTLNTTARQLPVANHQPLLSGEHPQLITMDSIAEQNQLDVADVYQLTQQQHHLNEKHHQQQQSTILQATLPTGLTNESDLLLHSNQLTNLNSLNTIDSTATIDHLNAMNNLNNTLSSINNLNNLNNLSNIELINNSFGQSVFNIDNNGQLSPYLDLDQLKSDQSKQNLLINTLLTEKYPNSLLVSGDDEQSKQYSPSSFVQFQLLNDSIPDHQSIIISSISSNSTHTTTLPSSNQQSSNANQQFITNSGSTADATTATDQRHLINDYHLCGPINHKDDLKSEHKPRTSAITIKRDYYRSNSIELSACFWYTIALACHQKVPFKRSSFGVFLLSSVWRFFTLVFACFFTANLTAYLNKSALQSIHSDLPLVPIILQPDIQIACSWPICNQFQTSKSRFMQQINEKIIKINSKNVKRSLLSRLLYGKTIYLTNDYEARYLASKHCNLTVMKLDANFLGLNLINAQVRARQMMIRDGDQWMKHQSNQRASDINDGDGKNDKFQYKFNDMISLNGDFRSKHSAKLATNDDLHVYEFEPSELKQHFGLTFRQQSPYYRLFAEKMITLSEQGLIANLLSNLLAKWSRSTLVCDSIRSGNLYSNSNELDHLNLHNDRATDSLLLRQQQLKHAPIVVDNSMLVDGSSMAKLKKLENNLVQNNNVFTQATSTKNDAVQSIGSDHFRADSKSDQFYYATGQVVAVTKSSGRLANSLNRLFKQITSSLSINEYPWLNRISFLLALGLSLACLLVLAELFIAIVIKKNSSSLEARNDLDKRNDNCRQTNKKLTDKLASTALTEEADEEMRTTDRLVTTVDINCPQHCTMNRSMNRTLDRKLNNCTMNRTTMNDAINTNTLDRTINNTMNGRPLITTIATTDILQHQLDHQIEQHHEEPNLYNNFNEQSFDDNLLFTSNCPQHYAYHISSRFDNSQVSISGLRHPQPHTESHHQENVHLDKSFHHQSDNANDNQGQHASFQTIVYNNHLESSI